MKARVLLFVFAAFRKCALPGTGEERTLRCMILYLRAAVRFCSLLQVHTCGDPRTHEGKLFNSWRFSGDGSCHEETPFSPGSTSTCHARSQGNLAHSTRSRRNKRLNGKQDTTKVLRASPNPAAHGVGTTSPRQGRLKPTTRTKVTGVEGKTHVEVVPKHGTG